MFGMTNEQILGTVRHLMTAVGPLLVALGVTTAGSWETWMGTIMNVAGPILTLVGFFWSMTKNSRTGALTTAANLPEVKKIELAPVAPTQAARNDVEELSRATPSEVVVAPTPR
jgi:hypothetical protein